MTDNTTSGPTLTAEEQARQALLADAPEQVKREQEEGRPIWTTTSMQAEFTVEAFAAPFVLVKRKSDGVRGTLQFTHVPRFYFAWVPEA